MIVNKKNLTLNLPFFYSPHILPDGGCIELEEENARHIIQVLRMKLGYELKLTDGKGTIAQCVISEIGKKTCTVMVKAQYATTPPSHKITIAVSLLKNAGRFEWFLEKAVETGVHTVVPLICHRTERQAFKESRIKNIVVSAMLQSQQSWLTEVSTPQEFLTFIGGLTAEENSRRYIAHCEDQQKIALASAIQSQDDSWMLTDTDGDITGHLRPSSILTGTGGDGTGQLSPSSMLTGTGGDGTGQLSPSSMLKAEADSTRQKYSSLTSTGLDGDANRQFHSLILIGPEGDFTIEEITTATTAGFIPVSLGDTRLRTETAAITAAILLKHLGIEPSAKR